MTVTSKGNHRAGGHFQIFNLGVLFVQPLGSVPYPSFPALCRADITFHGSTDYGEHHAIMGSISRPRCAPWRPWRLESGQVGLIQQFGAGLGGQGSQDAAQEAGWSRAATRTRSYAHCGLEDMSANNEGKHNIFSTFAKATIFGPESGRAKRYAQRDILNMRALERIMLSMVRCEVCKS